jgi:hypothetical protein
MSDEIFFALLPGQDRAKIFWHKKVFGLKNTGPEFFFIVVRGAVPHSRFLDQRAGRSSPDPAICLPYV